MVTFKYSHVNGILGVGRVSTGVQVQQNAELRLRGRGRCNMTDMTVFMESIPFHLRGNGKFQMMKESAFSS